MISRFIHKRALERWTRAAEDAPTMPPSALRHHAEAAKALRTRLNDVIYQADRKLAAPKGDSASLPQVKNADWVWRPKLWRGPLHSVGMVAVENQTPLGSEAKIFHDCAAGELSFRQVRNAPDAAAPYAVRMDVLRFQGSFLSLAIDFPPEGRADIRMKHLIRLKAVVECERDIALYTRLNIRSGPNTATLNAGLPMNASSAVEFDLAHMDFNEKRVEAVWLDLIFGHPEMNQVTIRDVTLTRSPRADV